MTKLSKACAQCGHVFFRDNRNTYAHWKKAKFCSTKCTANYNSEMAALRRLPISELFDQKVNKDGPNGCWLWTGNVDRNGYGIFSCGHEGYPRTQRAHRFSLQMSGASVPKGAFVCHHCDTPQCVNPAHLYVGTPQTNVSDAVARGRVPRGERVWMAKLTEAAVREIRKSTDSDTHLALLFGVSRAAVTLARNGKTWAHVK